MYSAVVVQEVLAKESLEDEESSGWPFKVDKDQLKESSKLVLLQLHEKLQKNSLSTILTSFSICSKLGRWKSSISGCLMSWLKIQKTKTKTSFWGIIFYSMQQQWMITGSDCDVQWKVDFRWQPVTTSSVAGLRRSSKALPKAKFDQKKKRL